MCRILLLGMSLLAVAITAEAEIFKCEDADGKVTYAQIPCARQAQPVELRVHQPSAADQAAVQARIEAAQRLRERDAHKREVRRAQKQIRILQEQQAAALGRVDAKRALARNNLAGATWEQALATDQQRIVDQYGPQIEAAHQRLRDLQGH